MRGRIRLIEAAIAPLQLPADARVLDVAAGDGYLSRRVVAHTGGRLIAADHAADECRRAREAGTGVLRSDVRHLPVADGAADLTIAFEIIEHFAPEDAPRVVCELRRVTRPGGTLLLSTPNRFSLESLRGLVNYARNGTPWTARDDTHRTIYTPGTLTAALAPHFAIERMYGYWLVPDFKQRRSPWTMLITRNRLVVPFCFLLFVVARAK